MSRITRAGSLNHLPLPTVTAVATASAANKTWIFKSNVNGEPGKKTKETSTNSLTVVIFDASEPMGVFKVFPGSPLLFSYKDRYIDLGKSLSKSAH